MLARCLHLTCGTKRRYVANTCHTSPQPELSQQGTITQCAGTSQHVLGVHTAQQGHSCGITSSSAIAHALWGRLWSSLGCRCCNGIGLLILWDKTVINNIFGEVWFAPKHLAKAPNPTVRFGPYSHTSDGNMPWPKITSKQTALGCSAKQNVVMSRRRCHKHESAPLSLYNRNTAASFLTTKTVVRRNEKNNSQTGCHASTSPYLHTVGGGT